MRNIEMIDYDNEEVRWWMREIEHVVQVKQSEWEEVTVESVVRELSDVYGVQGTPLSDDLLEMVEGFLQRYSDPFYGLGDANMNLRGLTESGKNALFTAVTAKSKLLKAHAAELDAYVKTVFGESANEIEPQR
jgi:hypothetical protein